MENIIYVTGHKNPDSDSICSAIAYAEFKNKTQKTPAKAIRLGKINRETEFILNYFGVEPPEYITTVKTQVKDLDIDTVAPISPEISLKMAWSMMKKTNNKTLPVVDSNDHLVGIVSVSNLASNYLDIWDNYILAKSNTTLGNIVETLSAKIIFEAHEKLKLSGKVIVATMNHSDGSNKTTIENEDIVICGDIESTQQFIIERGAKLMIICSNKLPAEGIIKLAKENQCTIISTPFDAFTASRLIPQSIPISHVMTKKSLISFNNDDFIEDIKEIMTETRYRSYPVLDSDGKVVGSISRYHLITQNRKKVILVDHNEKSQSVDGLEDAEVLQVIDHHRIGDIQTGLPIHFRNEPVGSTCTIVASIYFENGIRPSKQIAGILCGAIISDTLMLKSPTSTIVDEIMLRRLAEIADIKPEEFAMEMFKTTTSLEGKSLEEILHQDFKAFSINSMKIGVGQVNTTYLDGFKDITEGLKKLMAEKAANEGFDAVTLMITDIFKRASLFLVAGNHKELIFKAFSPNRPIDDTIYVEGVVSRKKQVIPPITEVIMHEN